MTGRTWWFGHLLRRHRRDPADPGAGALPQQSRIRHGQMNGPSRAANFAGATNTSWNSNCAPYNVVISSNPIIFAGATGQGTLAGGGALKGGCPSPSEPTQRIDISNPSEAVKQTLKSALQQHRAAVSSHSRQLREHQLEVNRLEKALEVLGEDPGANPVKTRCEVLRDYILEHPNEEVTTILVRANPAKYGIISSSANLQMNWLHGRNNPTARRLFVVTKGVIRLRQGITQR